MNPKFRCWFKDTGTRAAHMVEWDKLKEFVGLGRLFDDSKKSTLFNLMQSTGLKDKNGVEIFEGDIIKGEQYLTTRVPTAITEFVEYSERNTGFYVVNKTSNHERYKQTLGDSIYQYEIIGNIYQHPELLEGESG